MINSEARQQKYIRPRVQEMEKKTAAMVQRRKMVRDKSSDNEAHIKKGCETLKPIDVKKTMLNVSQGIESFQHV